MTTRTIQEGTIGVKRCHTCCSEGYEHDRFCRRCGAKRTGSHAPHSAREETAASDAETSDFRVSSSHAAGTLVYHTVSGPLVKSVTASLSANTRTGLESKLAQRVILVVISIPIWLIIVLLSPIDAYTAARAAIGQKS